MDRFENMSCIYMTSFGFRRDGADISPLRSISEMIFSVQGISALAVFLIVSIAANQFGDLAARIKFPLISGYITAGIVAGPYLLDIVSAQDLQEILFINDIALAFIAFCAGSELYFPEIRNLFKIIMVHLTCIVVGTFGVIALVVFTAGRAFEFFAEYSPVCKGQVSLLFGALMVERAASSALAVISETKAKGTLTKTSLGITVASDVVLLILFAFTSTFAQAACTSLGVNSDTFVSLLVSLLICAAGGFVLGEILIFYLWIPKIHSPVRGFLILPTGYGVFYLSHWFESNSKALMGLRIDIEPLLMCLIASCIAGNESKNRRKFANILHKCAPYVFVPFFTLTGSSLDLRALLNSLAFASILVLSRGLVLLCSTYLAGKYLLKQEFSEYKLLWMTLTPQAGTLLGLLNELKKYGSWTQPIVSASFGALIINNMVGSKIFKWAIIKSGEGKSADEDDDADSKKLDVNRDSNIFHQETVRIFGVDSLALSVGVKICEFGYSTTIVAPKTTPVQKLSMALQYVNSALQTIKSSSKKSAEIMESFANLEYNLCTELIDLELMTKSFLSMNLPSLGMSDEKLEEVNLVEEFKETLKSEKHEESFLSICKNLEHMIDFETAAIVLGFAEDQTNWICLQYIIPFLEKQGLNRNDVKIVVIIKEASWSQKFFKCGAIPVYSLSAITDIISRVAVSRPNEPLLIDPEDVYELIHPMEQGTKCGLKITDSANLPQVKNFDASPRLVRRMSVRSLFDGNAIVNLSANSINFSPETSRLKESTHNALSGLNTLGLADTTYDEAYPAQQNIVFTIFDEGISQLSDNQNHNENEPLLARQASSSRINLKHPVFSRARSRTGSLRSLSHRSSPSGSYNEPELKHGFSFN